MNTYPIAASLLMTTIECVRPIDKKDAPDSDHLLLMHLLTTYHYVYFSLFLSLSL